MLVREIRTYELDSNIAESIMLLNMKGYKTNFCCGGHPSYAYIDFDRSTSLILDRNSPIYNKEIKQNHPTNWYIDDWADYVYYKTFTIRRRNFTQEEILMNTDEQLMDMVAKELREWVESLPIVRNSRVLYEIVNLSDWSE